MEQMIGAETEVQKPTLDKFNDRIKHLIEEKPYPSATDQAMFVDLIKGLPKSYDLTTKINSPLWELSQVIQTNLSPYKDNPAPERIKQHGITIQETAIYIAHRVQNGAISLGTDSAKTLSEQLFNYGESLIDGKRNAKPATFNDVARIEELSQKQTQAIDHLLGIDKFFRLSTKFGNDIESQRDKILNDFFFDVGRTASPFLEPTTPYTRQITEAIEAAITMPVEELEKSVIRRKTEILAQETPPNLHYLTQKIANHYNINIDEHPDIPRIYMLQQILEIIRDDQDVTAKEVGESEKQIAQKIQRKVNSVITKQKRQTDQLVSEYQPKDKYYYTLAVKLGANLMEKAGLECLIGNTDETSGLFLITTDARVFLMDMSQPRSLKFNEVTNSVQSSALFIQTPESNGIKINIKGKKDSSYTLYTPEDGQRTLTLFDMALDYRKRTSYPFRRNEVASDKQVDLYQRSIKTFEKITTPDLQDQNIWYEYGETLLKYVTDTQITIPNEEKNILKQKTVFAFQQVIGINPDNYQAYNGLYKVFKTSPLEQDQKRAIEYFKKAKEIKRRKNIT